MKSNLIYNNIKLIKINIEFMNFNPNANILKFYQFGEIETLVAHTILPPHGSVFLCGVDIFREKINATRSATFQTLSVNRPGSKESPKRSELNRTLKINPGARD